MLFRVERASDSFGEPCEEAELLYEDEKRYWSEYYLEVNTLEDLIALNDKYGKLVVMDEIEGDLTHIPHKYMLIIKKRA